MLIHREETVALNQSVHGVPDELRCTLQASHLLNVKDQCDQKEAQNCPGHTQQRGQSAKESARLKAGDSAAKSAAMARGSRTKFPLR